MKEMQKCDLNSHLSKMSKLFSLLVIKTKLNLKKKRKRKRNLYLDI